MGIPSISELGNWWSLSSKVQEVVKGWVPNKQSWTLHLTKNKVGDWHFSLPQFLTINESLTNGTENVIDYHFEQLHEYVPCIGEKLTMTISSKPLEDWDTTLLYWDKDVLWPESSWYIDSVSDMNVWLCPYLQVLFKSVPSKLWVKFHS